ncbi:hypothetical protein AAOGI_41320 [Agarivorans albus]
MKYSHLLLLPILIMPSFYCNAGVDIYSKVLRVKLNNEDKLWIKMEDPRFDQYCKPGWFGFNLYIPKSNPDFPYYYSLINTAIAKNQKLYIANIDVFSGTTGCDLTKTGYGIVLLAE